MAAIEDDQAAGSAVPAVALSSGKPMPRIGLGTASFPLGNAGDRPVVREAVLRALDAGYRHFDTSAVYGTERAIGDAVAEAVSAGTLASRDDVYITSKLWIADAHPGHVLPALRKTLQ
jgi:diketogulonate reductase-like aldo/keto reductase